VKPGRRFGSIATEALKKFQHNHGLSADGVYTAATHVKFRDFLTGYAAGCTGTPPCVSNRASIRRCRS
jgi:Putative peptidoglycan binding domain